MPRHTIPRTRLGNRLTIDGRRLRRIACLGALLAASGAVAQDPTSDGAIREGDHRIEVYVSDEALQALYLRDVSVLEDRRSTLQGGVFFTERRDIVGIAGMLSNVADANRFPRWTFDVGVRGYGALLDEQDQDVFGLALGGNAHYAIGQRRQHAIAIGGFYAPDILTFGQADDIIDASVRFETEVRDGLVAFAGYRIFEFSLAADRELDDHAHVGVRWAF